MTKKFLFAQLYILTVCIILAFIIPASGIINLAAGYLLSFIFVGSSIRIIERFWEAGEKTFMQVFFFTMAIRFVIVLITFGILIKWTKIDEIYFTVSFIISYLYQSVTETILIHKILNRRST